MLVTGYFHNTVDFGGGNLVSAGGQDIFVAKYNSAGVHQWSQRFGSTSLDVGYAVAADVSGNVIVAGYFYGTVNFGGVDLVSAGNSDIFVARYNSAGVHQWSQRFGSGGSDYGYAVALDGSGNVLVTGDFFGTVNFGGGNLVSAGGQDIFVAKYNSAGVHQWSQRFGSTSTETGRGVALDALGNVAVTGYFQGTVNFGGGNLVSAGGQDIFVAEYSSVGAYLWSRGIGSTSIDVGNAVALDGSQNLLVTGNFNGTVNFGGIDLVSAGGYDVFIAKYTSSGVHLWSNHFGSTLDDISGDVTADGAGNALVTGLFRNTVNFGGNDLVSAGVSDIFVAKWSKNPAEPVIASITDIGNDQGRKVRIVFTASGHDAIPDPIPVVQYEAYRRIDDLPAASSWPPAVVDQPRQVLDGGWTQAGAVASHTQDEYSMEVPTLADSTLALGQYYSVFFIRAATDVPSVFYDSAPDSGYSLDNLAPGVPGSFAYSAGVLSWDESTAEDFDYFSIYGSNTNSFAAATLVDYCVSPTMDVTASPYVFYFVTATDFSGNEGAPAVVNTLSGTGGTPKSYVLSISAYPNPFNPGTTIRYTVPSAGRVSVAIYDTRGAHVATLVDERKDAGAYTETWEGRDDDGRVVSSGVYFARVRHVTGEKSYKIVVVR
jgi:hypothetical protein